MPRKPRPPCSVPGCPELTTGGRSVGVPPARVAPACHRGQRAVVAVRVRAAPVAGTTQPPAQDRGLHVQGTATPRGQSEGPAR